MNFAAELKKVPVFQNGGKTLSDRQMLKIKALLRPDEAADILRVSKRSIYRMCDCGKLKTVRHRDTVRIRSESVRKILDEKA